MEKSFSWAALAGMVGGALGLYLEGALFGTSASSIAAQAAAVALWLWARISFGRRSFHAGANPTPGELVTHGPYRYIRHPIYTSVSLFAWAGALAAPSALAFAFATLVTGAAMARMFCEERLLARAYVGYRAYARRTRRMLPFLF
jgi:protein-S-isoprenylcysteine O-methyltransferase Ste14